MPRSYGQPIAGLSGRDWKRTTAVSGGNRPCQPENEILDLQPFGLKAEERANAFSKRAVHAGLLEIEHSRPCLTKILATVVTISCVFTTN